MTCHCGCGEPTGIARWTDRSKGWVRGEPKRYVNGHNRRLAPVDYLVDEDGCWIWQKGRSRGYGRAVVGTRIVMAHRLYYERCYGPADGLEIHHKCGKPSCVNPEHLQAVGTTAHRRYHDALRGRDVLGRFAARCGSTAGPPGAT